MQQSERHTHTANLGGFLTWVTLAEKADQQTEEWMAQLQHQASTCSNTTILMMMQMMMTITVTTIITDHNMLGIQFALTLQCVTACVSVRWLCNGMLQNGSKFMLVCLKL